jgi:hypothetical protein
MLEFYRSSAVRVALAFVLVTTLATTAVFALVYFRIGEANEARNRLILETEAAKSVNRSVEELRNAFEVRLTNDLRRIDYAALFDANHRFMFGNIEALLPIPLDGTSHFIAAAHVPGSVDRLEPAIFAIRRHHHAAGPKPVRDPGLPPHRAKRASDRTGSDAAARARDRRLFRPPLVATPYRHS